jgi:hypothetical protein
VFCDIDDTLTDDGRLGAAAYGALERLHAAGLKVVPITGRPAGWCDLIARQWPVDAVVGENGAFYFWLDRTARKLKQRFLQSDAEREAGRIKLEALRALIPREVKGAGIASDQPYRLADLASDFCEAVPPLPRDQIAPAGGAAGDRHHQQAGPLQPLQSAIGRRAQPAVVSQSVVDIGEHAADLPPVLGGKLRQRRHCGVRHLASRFWRRTIAALHGKGLALPAIGAILAPLCQSPRMP